MVRPMAKKSTTKKAPSKAPKKAPTTKVGKSNATTPAGEASVSSRALHILHDLLQKNKGEVVLRGEVKAALEKSGVTRETANNVLTGLTTRFKRSKDVRGWVTLKKVGAQAGFVLKEWPKDWEESVRTRAAPSHDGAAEKPASKKAKPAAKAEVIKPPKQAREKGLIASVDASAAKAAEPTRAEDAAPSAAPAPKRKRLKTAERMLADALGMNG